jgi:hypothetical protein
MTSVYDNKSCLDKMTFQECELAILREAVDESEKIQGRKVATNDDVKEIIKILEDFLQKRPLICYGGTAINNILPKSDQFYNRDLEIPDYDFYSKNALDIAKELADIYVDHGYTEVEAKAGMHYGTFKVFVNFIPIADITHLDEIIFDELLKDSIKIAGIKYASPNFLRMNMFLELSRPAGDVSRWEKIYKRLVMLNKHYPLDTQIDCNNVSFQRVMEKGSFTSLKNCNSQTTTYSSKDVVKQKCKKNNVSEEDLHIIIRDCLTSLGSIFFGGYACTMYSKYMPENEKRIVKKIPDFDVILEDIDRCALILKERLEEHGFTNIELIQHANIGEIIPRHIEVRVNSIAVSFIYEPIACHSYNKIIIGNGVEVCVATIDTMLTFYLAFMYAKKQYYQKDRILCMAMFLFKVQQKNRLNQKGLLKRFTIECYGKQPTFEEIRAEKAEKIRELNKKKGTREYDEWFLKYNPNINEKRQKAVSEKDPILNSAFKKTSGFEKVIEEQALKEEEKEKEKEKEKEPIKPRKNKLVEKNTKTAEKKPKKRKKNKTYKKKVEKGFLF